MKNDYMLIGAPGSGKSTWAKKQPFYHIVCRDSIREMLYGGYGFKKEDEPMIMLMAESCIDIALHEGVSIIIDECLPNRFARFTYLDTLHQAGRQVTYVLFKTPLDVCIERRIKDDKGFKQDWVPIVAGIYKAIQAEEKAIFEEDYDEILVI